MLVAKIPWATNGPNLGEEINRPESDTWLAWASDPAHAGPGKDPGGWLPHPRIPEAAGPAH
jgi:hypothetical protein